MRQLGSVTFDFSEISGCGYLYLCVNLPGSKPLFLIVFYHQHVGKINADLINFDQSSLTPWVIPRFPQFFPCTESLGHALRHMAQPHEQLFPIEQ